MNKIIANISLLVILILTLVPFILQISYDFNNVTGLFTKESYLNILTFVNALFPLVTYITLNYFIKNEHQERIIAEQKKHLQEVESLTNELRKQKHDFQNHLQVLYGLIRLGRYEDVLSYIDHHNTYTQNFLHIEKIKNPTLAAFLKEKTIEAVNKGITFQVKLQSPVDELKTSPYTMVKILGNLINNAFDAALSEELKMVMVEVTKEEDRYAFTIINSGNLKGLENKIFTPGFTTKGEGHGNGLNIVLETVQMTGGNITLVESEPVVFKCIIP